MRAVGCWIFSWSTAFTKCLKPFWSGARIIIEPNNPRYPKLHWRRIHLCHRFLSQTQHLYPTAIIILYYQDPLMIVGHKVNLQHLPMPLRHWQHSGHQGPAMNPHLFDANLNSLKNRSTSLNRPGHRTVSLAFLRRLSNPTWIWSNTAAFAPSDTMTLPQYWMTPNASIRSYGLLLSSSVSLENTFVFTGEPSITSFWTCSHSSSSSVARQ